MATASDIERNAHIPNEIIKQDIVDTEREIAQMEREEEHLKGTPVSMINYRWNHMMAEARRNGIRERQEFIAKLRALLAARSIGAIASEVLAGKLGEKP